MQTRMKLRESLPMPRFIPRWLALEASGYRLDQREWLPELRQWACVFVRTVPL